jgi:DsbC/DsbD-like thiol-disulfide interchange protein
MNRIVPHKTLGAMALTCIAALIPATLQAGPAADVVSVTLVPGWKTETGSHMAGLRIALAPGWKTYWRVPGDSGIPPEFAFAGSDNLESATLHWPRPDVFESYGLETIGYIDEVIVPVELRQKVGDEPVTVAGQGFIGVCQDVCLPVEVAFDLTIPPGAGKPVAAIAAALARVPARYGGPGTVTCGLVPIDDGLRVTATLLVPSQGGQERVFFEPDRADVWVSPAQVTRQGGTLTAVADMVPPDARPFALNRSGMRFTVLGETGAVEMLGCQAD